MSVFPIALKRFAKLGLILMMGAGVTAEAGLFGIGGDSWKEEVLLYDGSKIIVQRSQGYGGRHEIGQPSPVRDQTVSFPLPGSNKTVSFTSEYSDDVGSTNFVFLALHVLNGTPYIAVTPYGCLAYNKWGGPNPPYVFFKYGGKEWQRIPLSEFPAEFTTVNLDFGMPWDIRDRKVAFDKGDMLSAETIKRKNEKNINPANRIILREGIANAGGSRCGELIQVNDGWEGTGFFSRQPSYEACLKYCERKEVSTQNCPCNRFFKGK